MNSSISSVMIRPFPPQDLLSTDYTAVFRRRSRQNFPRRDLRIPHTFLRLPHPSEISFPELHGAIAPFLGYVAASCSWPCYCNQVPTRAQGTEDNEAAGTPPTSERTS